MATHKQIHMYKCYNTVNSNTEDRNRGTTRHHNELATDRALSAIPSTTASLISGKEEESKNTIKFKFSQNQLYVVKLIKARREIGKSFSIYIQQT